MTSHIDFRTLPNNIPSLCIPRVFSNITEERICRIFGDLALGDIERIDMVSKTTEKGEKFNCIFVHFRRWYATKDADTARERLLNGKDIKIVYDDPWFWKVSAYRPPAPKPPIKTEAKVRPHIDFDEESPRRQHQKAHQKADQEQHKKQKNIRGGLNMRIAPALPPKAPPKAAESATAFVVATQPIPVNKMRFVNKKDIRTPLKIEEDKPTKALEEGEIKE